MVTAEAEDRRMLQVRIPRDLLRRVDHVAVEMEASRAAAVARLLRAGLEQVNAAEQ